MKKFIGLGLIILAIILAVIIAIVIAKKGTYRGDILELLIDSWEFIILLSAMVLLGITFIKN